jgi:hypothetical protein
MVVSEHHSAFDRGRIPAHALREVSETRSLLNKALLRESGHRVRLIMLGVYPMPPILIHTVMQFNKMLLDHYMSYDKVRWAIYQF